MADFLHQRITWLEEQLSKNPQTPLFTRLAAHYLQAGRAEDALRLCDEGLSQYPFYSTAHLIKGKALVELGMMAEAKREFQVVHELLPDNAAVAKLHAGIDLGPSADISAAVEAEAAPSTEAPAVETAPPEEAQTIAEAPVTEAEVAPPQETFVEEQPAAPAEETPQQETVAAEPVTEEAQTPPAEPPPSDGFSSFGEPPTAAPEASLESFGEQPQPEATDFGFGGPPQNEQPTEEVQAFPAEPQAPEDSGQAEFGAEQPQEQQIAEPAAEEPTPPAEEVSTPETAAAETEQPPSWQEAFSQLEQPPQGGDEVAATEQAQEENPFAAFEAEAQLAEGGGEEEGYDVFAARKRMEYFGSEDSMTLEEYLASGPTGSSSTQNGDRIEEIAEKLKTPTKITPVINFTEKAPRPASEADTPASTGFVTPTLAEIYVKQGWYDDAIKAYRTLAANKPGEREKFDRRIAEIEELKKQQG
jgi:tetratricopeptide (TPR) repeat protein